MMSDVTAGPIQITAEMVKGKGLEERIVWQVYLICITANEK